jgi:putative DNA primase/helicase
LNKQVEVCAQPTGLAAVLGEAGLNDLTKDSQSEAMLGALNKLAAKCRAMSEPERLLIRIQAAKRLKEIGVTKAAELVDSVIDKTDKRPDGGHDKAVPFAPHNPWPQPVDGAALLDAVVGFIERHMILEPGAAVAIALWAVYTHIFDAFDIAPILLVSSPVKRCGKTRLLTIVSHLVARALAVSGISAAAMFRMIEAVKPTLLVDEGDTMLRSRNEDLRQVFNAGHTRSSAFILRCTGDTHEPRPFSTWAPKLIAMIGLPADTIADRSILVRMRRREKGEHVEKVKPSQLREQLQPLARMAARWTSDIEAVLKVADPAVPAELHDRAADNWTPLLAIADAAGGPWPARAREAALATAVAGEQGVGTEVQLLMDIQELFGETGEIRLSSGRIVEYLIQLEDRPWPEWRNTLPMTKPQLADALQPFGIKPKKMRFGADTVRGYELADFAEVFARYLPEPEQVEQAEQPDLFSAGDEKEDDAA